MIFSMLLMITLRTNVKVQDNLTSFFCRPELEEITRRNNMHFCSGLKENSENFNDKLHIFRCNKVNVSDSVIYPDPGDIFIREPFIAKFSTRALSIIQHFAIIAIHTQPKVIFFISNKILFV